MFLKTVFTSLNRRGKPVRALSAFFLHIFFEILVPLVLRSLDSRWEWQWVVASSLVWCYVWEGFPSECCFDPRMAYSDKIFFCKNKSDKTHFSSYIFWISCMYIFTIGGEHLGKKVGDVFIVLFHGDNVSKCLKWIFFSF